MLGVSACGFAWVKGIEEPLVCTPLVRVIIIVPLESSELEAM